MNQARKMSDYVFICYSRKDEDFVLKLASNLKRQGVPVWLDRWDIPYGANWNRTIERALNECLRLLLILSPSSVASDEVQGEWLSALNEEKVVIPILYQPCCIPFRLKPIQYIDFTSRSPDDKDALEQILNALGIAEGTRTEPLSQKEHKQEKAFDWFEKGKALGMHGKYDEAIRACSKAIEINPKYASAWLFKGWALDNLGKYEEAIQAYNMAIEIDPKYIKAWNNKGMALKSLDRTTEADVAFAKSKELGIRARPGSFKYI